jgi:hypothetical protein
VVSGLSLGAGVRGGGAEELRRPSTGLGRKGNGQTSHPPTPAAGLLRQRLGEGLILVPLHLRRPASRERREHAWRGAEQLPGIGVVDLELALARRAEAGGDQGFTRHVGGGLAGAALEMLGTNGFHSAGLEVGAATE